METYNATNSFWYQKLINGEVFVKGEKVLNAENIRHSKEMRFDNTFKFIEIDGVKYHKVKKDRKNDK